MDITFDADNKYCAGEILGEGGRSILVQSDWDYPGVAITFGFYLGSVQVCSACAQVQTLESDGYDEPWKCEDCGAVNQYCSHDCTDGTVDCDCGVSASDFISAAYDYLQDNDGKTVEDPGYFGD